MHLHALKINLSRNGHQDTRHSCHTAEAPSLLRIQGVGVADLERAELPNQVQR